MMPMDSPLFRNSDEKSSFWSNARYVEKHIRLLTSAKDLQQVII